MDEEKPHGGMSTWLLWIIPITFVILLVPAMVPNFVRSHNHSPGNACIANLKQLDGAKEQWALEYKKKAGATVTMMDLVGATNYIKVPPVCSAGGTYSVNAIGQPPTCSIGSNTTLAHILP